MNRQVSLIDFSDYDMDFLEQVASRLDAEGVDRRSLNPSIVERAVTDTLADNANLAQILRDADKSLQAQVQKTIGSFLPYPLNPDLPQPKEF